MNEEALVRLGRLLSGMEAAKIAARLADGDTLTQALQGVPTGRRVEVKKALNAAGLAAPNRDLGIAVLRALQGAGSRKTDITPVWTLPGHLAGYGQLTTSIHDLVLQARQSVVCSTFNFQKSSALWQALREVALRGTVEIRLYMDSEAAANPWGSNPSNTPTPIEVANQLKGALVFRTTSIDGTFVRNHAKFVAVDHRFLVVTSANFSLSAEQKNVELGLRVDSSRLAEQIERQLLDHESLLYERVT